MSRSAAAAAKARKAKIAARSQKARPRPPQRERPDCSDMDAERVANILAGHVHRMNTVGHSGLSTAVVARAVELLREKAR